MSIEIDNRPKVSAIQRGPDEGDNVGLSFDSSALRMPDSYRSMPEPSRGLSEASMPQIQEHMNRPGASGFDREAIAIDPFATIFEKQAMDAPISQAPLEMSSLNMPDANVTNMDFNGPDSMHRMVEQGANAAQGILDTAIGLMAPGKHELTGPESGHRADPNVYQTVSLPGLSESGMGESSSSGLYQVASEGFSPQSTDSSMFSSAFPSTSSENSSGQSFGASGSENLFSSFAQSASQSMWDLKRGISPLLELLGRAAKGVLDFFF